MSTKKKQKSKRYDSDEDDDIFYYRFCDKSSIPNTATAATSNNQIQSKSNNKGSSMISTTGESLAPSKSTLYVSNLDYSLTNSDLHTLFSTFGRIARVTVLKDRHTRLSRGVAFIQFVSRQDAQTAVKEMNKKILNGRTLTASIAADNGRAPEFIRRRVYNSETGLCFECGDHGHLSYECPKNQLGPRARPQPKKPRRGFGGFRGREDDEEDEEEDGVRYGAAQFEEENWASVVDNGAGERFLGMDGNDDEAMDDKKRKKKKKKGKRSGYFSDESDHDDDD
jgi:U11/U12 small nuclear ribonucleoprotein SNRNP31